MVAHKHEEAVFDDPAYINRSRYGVQIRPYLELFGHENVLLLLFEEYIADPDQTLHQVSQFLNLEPNRFVDNDKVEKHQTTGRAYLKYDAMRKFTASPVFQSVRSYIPSALRKPIRKGLSKQIEEKPEFTPQLRKAIWRFVEDDVFAIEKMMGRQLQVWREGYIQ